MEKENEDAKIGRLPIVNKDGIILGYEILFKKTGKNVVNVIDHVSATASALKSVYDIGLESLIGNKLGFIAVNPYVLNKGLLDILPENRIVFKVDCGTEEHENLHAKMRLLKNKGFRFCLKGFNFTPGMATVLKLSNYSEIDVGKLNKPEVSETLLLLKGYGKKFKFIASEVGTMEDFRHFREMDFELFEGTFYEKPSIFTSSRIGSNYSLLMKIFNEIQSKSDIKIIENLFKSSPEIIFRLLKVINSVIYDFAREISSVRQAIVLLGYEHLSRWILTLILASGKDGHGFSPIMESGLIKARMMEEICTKYIDKRLSDKAFLSGILSAIYIHLEVPLEELFKQINVSKIIEEALLEHKGELGRLVSFVDAYNSKDYKSAEAILKDINNAANMEYALSIEKEAIIYLESVKKSMS